MHYFQSILVCNDLEKEEKAGCFAFIVLKMHYYCKCFVALPHGDVGWSAVCVIVVFPDHTHLLFDFGEEGHLFQRNDEKQRSFPPLALTQRIVRFLSEPNKIVFP